MTLGLTSSGAIKIKTDRAVNCACCGGCGPPPYARRFRIESAVYYVPFVHEPIPITITSRSDYDQYDPWGYFYAESNEIGFFYVGWGCDAWYGEAGTGPYNCDGNLSSEPSPAEGFLQAAEAGTPAISLLSAGGCYLEITVSVEP